MRSAASFDPALGSCRSFPANKACHQGLSFTAYFPADQYARSLSQGEARLELWTDLPIDAEETASSSVTVGWKAILMPHCTAKAGDSEGFVFHVNVLCTQAAVDGAFGFTYRIVHPDGKVDWLGSPSCDGQIYVPSYERSQQIKDVLHPVQNMVLEAPELPEGQPSIQVSMLKPSHGADAKPTAFHINHADVASGIVVERTKSTWCTSRTFTSLSEVSSEFGSSIIVLRLSQSAQALVLMPIVESNPLIKLVRSHHDDKRASFSVDARSDAPATKISVAMGPVDDVPSIIAACRANAARALRTCVPEPLGLSWSIKKMLEDHPGFESVTPVANILPSRVQDSDPVEISFCSDSTAVEGTDVDDTQSTAGSSVDDASNGPMRSDAGVGFCTWEAMSNAERRPFLSEVIAAMKATQKRLGETAISSLLIDDGWQDVVRGPGTRGRLNSFDMDAAVVDIATSGEPGAHNLAKYVSTIRSEFPSVRHVGCWMTLAGYWDGIHASGPIASAMSGSLRVVKFHDPLRNADRDWMIQGSDLDMHLFWDRAFHHLKQCGIDFVKIDAQAEWDWIVDGRSTAFEAMEGAATRYFGAGSVIHSMGWVGGLTNSSKTLHSQGMTIRASDDFFPSVPEAHRHHLVHNSYNALQLPEHRCDADMFSACVETSTSDWTGYHASYRAFTDAKLWISDKADAPQNEAVSGLISPTMQGDSRVMQTRGSLIADSLFDDLVSDGPGRALKLVAHNGQNGCHTVGLWNTRGASSDAFDILDPRSIVHAEASIAPRYAAHSFQSQETWLVSVGEQGTEALPVTLKPGSWDTITFSPVLALEDVTVAPLGHVNKFMSSQGLGTATSAFLQTDQGVEALEEGRFSVIDEQEAQTHEPTTVRDYQEQFAMNRAGLMSMLFFNTMFALFYRFVSEIKRLTPFVGAAGLFESLCSLLSRLQAAVVFSFFTAVSNNSALLVSAQSETLQRATLNTSDLVTAIGQVPVARRIDLPLLPGDDAAQPSTSVTPATKGARRTRVVSQSVSLVSKVSFLVIPAATPGMQVKINGDLAPFRFSDTVRQTKGDLVEVDIPSWYSAQDTTELNALADSFQVQLVLP